MWRTVSPCEALSSAPVGGGRNRVSWVMNFGVPTDYSRTDLEAHAHEAAAAEQCDGVGITLFTAASVQRWSRGEHGGATVDATVGISKPTWAADHTGSHGHWSPGTINLVAAAPVPLSEAAAVNVVMTITEAKTQALLEAGVAGTGTASDAVVVLWPSTVDDASHEPERFGGPRSPWGSRLALAAYDAVLGAMPT